MESPALTVRLETAISRIMETENAWPNFETTHVSGTNISSASFSPSYILSCFC